MRMIVVVMAAVLVAAGPASRREELKTEKRIETKLQLEPDLRSGRIDVEVEDGVATLKGKVDTEAERTKAERVAWVKGVTRVDDWLVVGRRAAGKRLSDRTVTSQIETQYRADKTLGHSDISVATKDGVVTLAGAAPSEAARQRAIDVAEESPGVKRVEDRMQSVGEVPALLPPTGAPAR